MAAPPVKSMESSARPLSDFPLVTDGLNEIIYTSVDANLVLTEEKIEPSNAYDDIGGLPYIIGMSKAQFIPAHSLPKVGAQKRKIPDGLIDYNDQGIRPNVLLAEGKIFCDSFTRSKLVNPSLGFNQNLWSLDAKIDDSIFINDTCVFVELICNHFGHALLDTAARLWPLAYFGKEYFKGMKFVGFGTHGLGANIGRAKPFLLELLEAYGVPVEDIILLKKPTLFNRLIVPKRISPFVTGSGPLYNLFMNWVGDRIVDNHQYDCRSKKIFLSRSNLNDGNSRLDIVSELKIENIFLSKGYEIVHPQELSLSNQINIVRNADYIAGIEGSHLHLGAFRDAGGLKLIRIVPGHRNRQTDYKISKYAGTNLIDLIVEPELHGEGRSELIRWSLSERAIKQLALKIDAI